MVYLHMTSGFFIYCNQWIAGFVTCICVYKYIYIYLYIYMVDHWEGEHIYINNNTRRDRKTQHHFFIRILPFYLFWYPPVN